MIETRIDTRPRHTHELKTYHAEDIASLAGRAGWSTVLWDMLDTVTVCEACPESVRGIKVVSYSSHIEGADTRFHTYLCAQGEARGVWNTPLAR